MRRFGLAALAALVLAASASADDVRVPLTVRPGSLAIIPVAALARSARVSLTVTDARGHGAGWKLLARVSGPARLVVVTGVDVRCGAHSTCALPRTGVRYPVVLTSLRPVAILDAQRGTGMGAIVLTVRLGSHASAGSAALRFSVQPS